VDGVIIARNRLLRKRKTQKSRKNGNRKHGTARTLDKVTQLCYNEEKSREKEGI
jgi:hypothetical protein